MGEHADDDEASLNISEVAEERLAIIEADAGEDPEDIVESDDGLRYWNKLKTPPAEALKKIEGGPLKGFTDIKPVWRMEAFSEIFGPIGVGWYYTSRYEVTDGAPHVSTLGGVTVQFVDKIVTCFVTLMYRDPENPYSSGWSESIEGVGSDMLVGVDKNGPYSNDEAYKSAKTDALGNAMFYLGVGADVYWNRISSKYHPDKAVGKHLANSGAGASVSASNGAVSANTTAASDTAMESTSVIAKLFNDAGLSFKGGSRQIKLIKQHLFHCFGSESWGDLEGMSQEALVNGIKFLKERLGAK